MNSPNRDLFRSAIFVTPTLSSPQIPLNHSLYSQSPLHEKRPNYVSRTIYSPTVRSQPHGNTNHPIGSKALTSLLTKKIDLKAQMKVVKKFKEELKITHEDFIEGVKGFVKGLEEELREKIMGNNLMIKGDSIVCDDLKELEKMVSEESKGDVEDKGEMESRTEKTKKKGMEGGLGKELIEELARKKEEVEELRRIINEMRQQSIEIQHKPKEESKHSEIIKIPPQDLTSEGTQTKEKPLGHKKNVEEPLFEQKEPLQPKEEKEHSQKNSESPEFEIISSPQNDKIILEKEREIEKLHKSNEELRKELSQSQEKNQMLLKSLDSSERKLIEKTSQFDEILKELNFHQTNPNPKNLDLEQELEKLHSSYEELTKELMDKMQENHNLMGLLDSSDSKLTEKTTQYEELYKDFNSLLEEAAVRDQKLQELNDNLHRTQRLSITREEDILKLKEQLESIRKSSAFKKRAKKLSLICEEEESNKDSGDSDDDDVGSENLDNETEELKVIRLIRKDFIERKKELEVVINKKDQEIERIRIENEEYCRKISENYKEIENLKSDLGQKLASNEGESNLIENMKEELRLIKLVLDEETRKEQETTAKFMESEVEKCQRIEELEKKDSELAQIKISLETERKTSQYEINALEHYKEQSSNEINQIRNELNETRRLLDLEVIKSQEALVKFQETTHQKFKVEEELARISNFLDENHRKSQDTHREMQDSQILKDQELKTLYGELDKMRESNREIQESDKAKGLGMEQLREQLVQIQVYLEAEAKKYEISQKELEENGKEKERSLEEIRKLKEEICNLNEIMKTLETSSKMKETSQNGDINRLQDEIREKSMLVDTLNQNAAEEKKTILEELNKTKGLLETKTSEVENLLIENKEITAKLHDETVEVKKTIELEQKRNQETLFKYHESESLNQKLQSEITQLHEELTKSHLSHDSEEKNHQLTHDQLQTELVKLKHLHETTDISNQSNEELQYLNEELTKTRQLLDQETHKTQDLEAKLSTEQVKSEGLSHRILEITSLQVEIKSLNEQLDQQSRSSIEIQKKLNKELESSREMSSILTSLTQEKLKLEELLANKLETEIELKKSLVEVEDENELLKVRNQALDSEIHALKSEKAEVLTNLEEVQHEKENLELLLQDKLTLEIELKQNNEDYEAEIEKLKKEIETSNQIKNQKEKLLTENDQLFKTQKEQLLAEKEHLETLLQEKATEEADFRKIIESNEVEIKELQQREAEYVQYITHVLNEREHEKELLETTSQTASQTQEVASAGGNKNNERIKELEGVIENLKEEHMITQNKIKEELSIEITDLKVKIMEDDKEIKKLREGIEKIRIEKEEMQWKENQELVEKTNFIEKLKIENEELKKTKKIEETKKKEKTGKKSLTETVETEEREEKKKKGGVSKTVVKSVEKELQDKEQAFLEELEELKILLELVE